MMPIIINQIPSRKGERKKECDASKFPLGNCSNYNRDRFVVAFHILQFLRVEMITIS